MKQYTLVKLTDDYKKWLTDYFNNNLNNSSRNYESSYELYNETTFVYMGEIPNMPGHCIVMGVDTRKPYIGYHVENFIELDEDEI